jgi:tetratricopeptide repeat protein 30
MQEFNNAALMYEKLVKINPDIDDYKLYYAQSLFKACMYNEALKACQGIENPEYNQRVPISDIIIV